MTIDDCYASTTEIESLMMSLIPSHSKKKDVVASHTTTSHVLTHPRILVTQKPPIPHHPTHETSSTNRILITIIDCCHCKGEERI